MAGVTTQWPTVSECSLWQPVLLSAGTFQLDGCCGAKQAAVHRGVGGLKLWNMNSAGAGCDGALFGVGGPAAG